VSAGCHRLDTKTDLPRGRGVADDPAGELRQRLDVSVTVAGHGESLVDLLATSHGN